MSYSRSNPSPRYTELVALYRHMHEHGAGDRPLSAEKTFAGGSLMRHVERIKTLIGRSGARTILDYGAGKGALYLPWPMTLKDAGTFDGVVDYWDIDSVACYDPAYTPFSALPRDQFDGVVCTDVMEHCPEEDVPWIVDEIFSFALRFVYLNVACFPAEKLLPNGENAHCTVRQPSWWADIVGRAAMRRPGVIWEMWSMGGDGGMGETCFKGG